MADMELDVLWTQGRCHGDVHFVSNNAACFISGSFIKVCSLDEYDEASIQGPSQIMQCLCCDSESSLIAVGTEDSYIYILNYPSFDVLSQWQAKEGDSAFIQMCFAGNDYLLTLEGSPQYNITLWDWKTFTKLDSVSHAYATEAELKCSISIHPGFNKLFVFQQAECLHFFEIEDICQSASLRKSTIYVPAIGDKVGSTSLSESVVENLTFFDKMHHKPWGIHSELLHEMPLQVLFPDSTRREIVKFYDFLSKQERLQPICHCWLKDQRLLVACLDGTFLSVAPADLSVTVIDSASRDQETGPSDYVACMALHQNGLYVATNTGNILLVQSVDEWSFTRILSVKESPVRLKFSPDYNYLLLLNVNGSIILLDVTWEEICEMYLSVFTDDSRVVGMFAYLDYCITAKASGCCQVWVTDTGVLLSVFNVQEDLLCVEGCPTSSMLLCSAKNSNLYAVDITNLRKCRIVEILRPSEKAIHFIKCEPFGRFAILISYDPCIFIYRILLSEGLTVQGYISAQFDITDVAIYSQSIDSVTYVSALGNSEFEDSKIMSFELPGDFTVNYTKYWEDLSGLLSSGSLKLNEFDLKIYCTSVAAHYSAGLLICLPISKEILKFSYEQLGSLNLEVSERYCEIESDSNYCRILLSSSHDLLLIINDKGDVSLRNTQNFAVCDQKLNSLFHFRQQVAFVKDKLLIEGFRGDLICSKLFVALSTEKMPWNLHCEAKRKTENAVLAKMRPFVKREPMPWIQQQLLELYRDSLIEMKSKKQDFESKFQEIEKKLQLLAEENFLVPEEHQIKCEEFIIDDDIKEQMLKSRDDEIEEQTTTLKKKLSCIEKNVSAIEEECINSMMSKGKILHPIKEGRLLYNYSVTFVPENDKTGIYYSCKKLQLEDYLQHLKLKNDVKINFEEVPADESRENIGKELRREPLQLQCGEDKIDYVYILKYIIFKKRLAFNRLFDIVVRLRKDTVQKIKKINSRIKEILQIIGEDRSIWESTDDNAETMFEVTEEEIENANCLISRKCSEEPVGLGDYFLKDEWVTSRKFPVTPKYRMKSEKENIDILRKEMAKNFKEIDELIGNYEKHHENLVEEKLRWDLDINQDELQLFLLLFSISNISNFKNWERLFRIQIEDLEKTVESYKVPIQDLEVVMVKAKKEHESLLNDVSVIDNELQHISKMSRNKQAFLEAFERRPEIPSDEPCLNPYKISKRKKILPEKTFEDLNTTKNKPHKVPLALWKQLCCLREKKFGLEEKIEIKVFEINVYKNRLQELKSLQKLGKNHIIEKNENLQKMRKKIARCSYETPMVLSLSDSQVEVKYPDDLDFREVLLLKRCLVEKLNSMIIDAGNEELEFVQKASKARYQIERNEAKVRMHKLKLRDTKKEIEVIKSIPLTKDIQKIIRDPEGFSLQNKIDALAKSKQMEMDEITKQMGQVNERLSNIDSKRDILKKSINEKKREIEKLKGDIGELRKIEKLKKQTE